MTTSFPADWPNADLSQFVKSGTINWHIQDIGSGPTILFLHGAGASTHSWALLIEMAKSDYRCIALDLPGHGFTEGALGFQLGLAGASTEIRRLLARLQIAPDLIIGHSAGAAIAINLSADMDHYPVIAINGAFQSFEGWAGVVFPMMAKSMVALPWVRDFFTVPMAQSADIDRLLDSTGTKLAPAALNRYRVLLKRREHITGTLGMMSQWNLPRDLKRPSDIKAQIHFVQAIDDGTVACKATEKFRRSISNSETTEFPNGGHLIHEVFPERIMQIINQTIKAAPERDGLKSNDAKA